MEYLILRNTTHLVCMMLRHLCAWIYKVQDAFAVKNAVTNFSGWKTRRLVHTLLLTIWSRKFDSFPVSTGNGFMDLEAAFILLYNVSPCNWVSSGLDERIQQFHFEWIPSENFSLMLVCYPQMRVSWVAHPEFIYNLPPLLSQQIHWKVNMTYIFKIASLCMLVCARYWK